MDWRDRITDTLLRLMEPETHQQGQPQQPPDDRFYGTAPIYPNIPPLSGAMYPPSPESYEHFYGPQGR